MLALGNTFGLESRKKGSRSNNSDDSLFYVMSEVKNGFFVSLMEFKGVSFETFLDT